MIYIVFINSYKIYVFFLCKVKNINVFFWCMFKVNIFSEANSINE